MIASRKALLLNIIWSCLTLWLCHSIIIRCPLSGMLVVLQLCVVCLRYYVHLHKRTRYQSLKKGPSRQGHISFSSTLHFMQILLLVVLIDNTGENVTHLQHTLWVTVINLFTSNDVLHHWCWCGHSLSTVHRHHQQQQQWSQIQL